MRNLEMQLKTILVALKTVANPVNSIAKAMLLAGRGRFAGHSKKPSGANGGKESPSYA